MLSAQDGCSVQPLSGDEIAAFQQNIAAYAPKYSPGDYFNKSAANVRIPLQLIIKQRDDGYFPNGMSRDELEAIFLSCLRFVNEEMSPRIEFYVVKSDVISVNEALQENRFVRNNSSQVSINYPGLISDNSVPIFIGENNRATGEYPFGVAIGGRDLRGRWLLHELGHYFGLLHTYQDAEEGSNIALFPDGSPTVWHDGSYNGDVYCGDGSDPGLCYGDFISSTEPDIELAACGLNLGDFAYVRSCDVQIAGNDYTYNIDFFNAMGYWSVGANRLNEEQKQRMYDVITIPALGVPRDALGGFGGDMSFLLDENEPVNTFDPPAFEYFRQSAPIKMVHFTEGHPTELRDYFQGKVKLDYNGATNIDEHERPYIGDGVLKTDRFIPIGTAGETVQYDFSVLSEDCEPLNIYRSEAHIKTSDLIWIADHILGRNVFQDPYKKIAADVWYDGEINVFDMVEISKHILGFTNTLDVPYYRFVPKYPLTDDSGFAQAFQSDPFSATWTYDGQDYAYLPSETEESYLGSTKPGQSLPNTLSFPLKLDDERVQEADAVSFHAVRSGDVVMSTGSSPGVICETPVKESLLDEGTILEAGKLNKVTIQLNNTGQTTALKLRLTTNAESGGQIVKVFNESVSSSAAATAAVQKEAQTTTPTETLFAGLTSAKSDELNMILVSSDKAGGSSYVEFYVDGLVIDMPITHVLKLDCVASELYSKPAKEAGKFNKQVSISPVSVAVEQGDAADDSELNVVLSPNPVRETLKLHLRGKADAKVRQVKIFDLTGKVVYTTVSDELERGGITVSDFSPGLYIVNMSFSDGSEISSRFIKN